MSYLFLMLLWWPTTCYIWLELVYLYLADDFVVSLLLIRFCVLHFQHTIGLHATRHRRIASSFRDQSLFLIFQISLTSLFKLKADGIFYIEYLIWWFIHCMHSFFGVITLIHADFWNCALCKTFSWEQVAGTVSYAFSQLPIIWFYGDSIWWKLRWDWYCSGISIFLR